MSGFQHLTVEAKDTDKTAHEDTLVLFDDGWNPSEWLTITGNADLSLGAELYGVEFVDASLMLGDLDLYCSGYDVTTLSGSGDDTLRFSRMMSGSVFAGSGDDYIHVNGAGTTYLSGGSGADTFKFDAVGHLTTTIGDFSVARGDSMIFGVWANLTWHDNPVKLGPGAAMVDYLNAAASGGATGSVTANWFQFDGNTYIVFDYYPDAQYMQVSWQDNQWKQDGCMKLVGLVDLHGLSIDNLWTV
jgi:hypothetical protein